MPRVPRWANAMRIGTGRLAAVLAFVAVVVGSIVSSLGVSQGIRRDTITPATIDFDETVYYPALAFADGGNPYDPGYVSRYAVDNPFPPYAPSTLLIHRPLTLVPLEVAALVYAALTVVLTVVVAYVALRYNDLAVTSTRVLLVAALILLSRPGRQNVLNGQTTLEVVLGIYVALYFAQRSALVSGLGLAVSMLKPTFGIPLAILMLARRDVRAVVAGVLITAAVNLPLVAILAERAGGLSTFLRQITTTLAGFQLNPEYNPASSSLRVDLVASVSRFLGEPLTGTAQLALALVVLGVAAYAVSTAEGLERGRTRSLSATVICLAILLCGYHQAYDLVLLTLPLVALAARRLPAALFTPRLRWVLLLLFVGLAANYASSFGVLERLGIYEPSARTVPSARLAWLLLVSLNGAALVVLFVSYTVATFRLARRIAPNATAAGEPRPAPADASATVDRLRLDRLAPT